MMKSGNNEVI
jgi:hypothetical protein